MPAREAYSAARFVADAAQAIADATSRGLLPILVGGTGLYFKALLEGLSPIPPIDPAIRDRWRRQADVSDAATLHAELARRDAAAAARLRSADTQRVVRALEVIDSTGRSLADWQQEQGAPTVDPATAAKLVVDADRATLCRRADARVHAMLGAGALDEARALADLALDPALPAMRAIGVAPLVAAARGELALAAAAEAMAVETRQYIKRQQTWLKRHMIAWHALQEQETESRTAEAIAFIES